MPISNGLQSMLNDPSLLYDKAFIAGEWTDADDGATFAVVNPSRGDCIMNAPDLGVAETFGPVAPLYRFEDDADVIEKANDTIFGLASYFYANNLARVYRVAEALEYAWWA